MHYHVFLSYSRKDTPVMKFLLRDLSGAGLNVWTDEGIEPGTSSWQRAIETAILHACCVVCILSPDSAKSDWVREELNFARTHQKQIFLMLARGDERTAVPFGYSSYQWGDIRTQEAYRVNTRRLIATIQKHYGSVKILSLPAPPASEFPPRPGQTKPLLIKTGLLNPAGLLPNPFGWRDVSEGEAEIEGGLYTVKEFMMAKYPITNAQYQVFVEAEDGYRNPVWWEFSEEAAAWRKKHPVAAVPEHRDGMLPCTMVAWYEAIAFCRWLSEKTEQKITLPSEQQWLRAARGNDKRSYPWGEEFSTARCNTLKSNINGPTRVDQYPGGASPFNVMDMCGNVSEWSLSEWQDYGTRLTGSSNRVIKGGSWSSSRSFARVFTRDYAVPEGRYPSVGFRVCCVTEEE